ncbi:type II toxin-antitoxin system RelE/ParE family toxin [Pasteurella caecimuris]|uniref:type II toxin-antitoxin system RelE/ParE family toxin n=1 Tax=Rodentibacter caecimuris TaxID=1796644 RepID=UPI002150167E|nr:type II toxin-antitoxin system RelE/ParE family toxin [Pasteurella caecimuris]MCR1838454.1 type II toxin-antitoxin system RelE/ParE family toxin [Pasteurella caecimuris]MCU0107746.1 type II toxin-antitoxin system RelE/ParE family toxin [Pasteurella caecimuris]
MKQEWEIILQDPLLNWFESLVEDDLLKIYAALELLSTEGPQLGRPYADTIQGSKYPNLKELRVQSKLSVFRLFFIFDPIRQAIVLCGGYKKGKKGKKEKLFYKEMIALAEQTYDNYLSTFSQEQENERKI